MRIRPELIVGIALVLVAFVALFLVANILNPPPSWCWSPGAISGREKSCRRMWPRP